MVVALAAHSAPIRAVMYDDYSGQEWLEVEFEVQVEGGERGVWLDKDVST